MTHQMEPVLEMNAEERARTLHFARRLFDQSRWVAIAGTALVAFAGTAYGWTFLWPAAGIVLTLALLGFALPRAKRPEQVIAVVFVVIEALLVALIASVDVLQLDLLSLLMLPAAAACIVFPPRMLVATTAFTAALMVVTAFGLDAQRVIDDPPVLLLPLGVMVTVTLPSAAVRRLELRSLSSASTDALTGALNRAALETRMVDLSQQGADVPLRVAAVMFDLDHFKRVNDDLGHDVGDRVLREVVHRVRAAVGPMTPVYRVGGEEFLVLFADHAEDEPRRVAEQVRRAVAAAPVEGAEVSLSCGVAAGTLDHYEVSTIIRAADEALYEAKRAGRDRVEVGNLAKMYALDRPKPAASSGESVPARLREVLPLRTGRRAGEGAEPFSDGASARGTWLIRTGFEREHLRELVSALNTTHRVALGAVFAALVLSIPWMGWLVFMPAAVAVPAYHLAQRQVMHARHPEYVLGLSWLGVQCSILVGAALVADPQPYMLILFVPMLVGFCAYFPTRGAALGAGITTALCVAAGFIAIPDLAQEQPGVVAPFVALVASVALLSSIAGRASVEYRTQAVVDPLTGLMTRGALRSRLQEFAGTRDLGSSACVVAFDLDHFKAINDTRGHAAGDQVLARIGQTIRAEVGALQTCFRLGGDEFVVIAPLTLRDGEALAERLRIAIARTPAGTDLHITATFGVAATPPGAVFDFDAVARRADAALYRAKRAGRDRVELADDDPRRLGEERGAARP